MNVMMKDTFSNRKLKETQSWWKELKAKVKQNRLQTEVKFFLIMLNKFK